MSPYKITMPTGDVRSLPRVTEVIRAGMPRPALQEWELREVVKWAQGFPDFTHSHSASEIIAAWRKDHRKHADRGTAVHRWIAAILRGDPPPAMLASHSGYKIAFMNWMSDPDWSRHLERDRCMVEQTLASWDYGVAGTADLIVLYPDGKGVLYDWKTVDGKPGDDGAPMWPQQLAQLGAYASMDLLVEDGVVIGAEVPLIHAASVVRLYVDGSYRVLTVEGVGLEGARDLWDAVRTVARAMRGQTP